MSDPQRLLDGTSDPVALRLLSGALHEPPPPDLLARTLHAVGAAAPVGAAAGGVAAKVTAIAATKVDWILPLPEIGPMLAALIGTKGCIPKRK